MINHIFFISTLSLFDSLSTTQQIIIFVLLLTTEKPIRNSLSYLAGLAGSYFLCGLAGYAVLDKLTFFLQKYFPSSANMPDQLYYQAEMFSGIVFIVIGIIYYRKKIKSNKPSAGNVLINRFRHMNGWVAAGIGIVISLSSFPMSIPYIAALGKFALLKLSMTSAVFYILFYNIVYALPMIVIFFIYLFALRGTDGLHDKLHEKSRSLNIKLTTYMFIGVGALSLVDGLCFFGLGHSLLKGRYF
jgi:cytochrome c biogenesis protein CcdA